MWKFLNRIGNLKIWTLTWQPIGCGKCLVQSSRKQRTDLLKPPHNPTSRFHMPRRGPWPLRVECLRVISTSTVGFGGWGQPKTIRMDMKWIPARYDQDESQDV